MLHRRLGGVAAIVASDRSGNFDQGWPDIPRNWHAYAMKCESRPIETAQHAVHPQLLERVQRHLAHPWQQPLHAPTQKLFERFTALVDNSATALILDSGCGTGASTLKLAEQHPQHRVIGIDQSALRLQRLAPDELAVHGNAILLRAELSSFWRLFNAAGYHAERHYLLYPNPWPKAAHLSRRWHGHPVFADLVRTADAFELRSNWRIYVEEFSQALQQVGFAHADAQMFEPEDALTPFERKYALSSHALFRCLSGQRSL